MTYPLPSGPANQAICKQNSSIGESSRFLRGKWVFQSGSVSTTLTITPTGGFNQSVTFACGSLPNHSICSFSPSVVTPNGAAVTSTMTIETGVASASAQAPQVDPRNRIWGLPFVAGVLGLGLFGLRRRLGTRIAARACAWPDRPRIDRMCRQLVKLPHNDGTEHGDRNCDVGDPVPDCDVCADGSIKAKELSFWKIVLLHGFIVL